MIRVHHEQDFPDGLTSPDVYFTPGYGRAACVTSTSSLLSSTQISAAWSETVTCVGDLGVISVLLRHSPLVPQASDHPGLRSIVRGHPTIVLEPTDHDSAWRGLEKHCRTKTRKALRHGYTGIVRQASSQDLAKGGDFRRLYEQTMQRLSAAPRYFFSDTYYTELLDGLGSNLLIAEVPDQMGVAGSSLLLMRHEQRLHSHLSFSDPDHARTGSNNLLFWTATRFAIDQGLRQVHLGVGLDGRDSHFTYKQRFGGREQECAVSGLIVNDAAYQHHVDIHAKALETTANALLASGCFPAYRAETC